MNLILRSLFGIHQIAKLTGLTDCAAEVLRTLLSRHLYCLLRHPFVTYIVDEVE